MSRMTQRPSHAQQNRRGGAPQDRFDQEKSAAILGREVVSIGDNFNKILKLSDRAYSRRIGCHWEHRNNHGAAYRDDTSNYQS